MSEADQESREQARARRRSRRGSAAARIDTTIPSPCISVCQIDDDTNCCIGCFRAIDEIREWPILSAAEKLEILDRIAERKLAAGV